MSIVSVIKLNRNKHNMLKSTYVDITWSLSSTNDSYMPLTLYSNVVQDIWHLLLEGSKIVFMFWNLQNKPLRSHDTNLILQSLANIHKIHKVLKRYIYLCGSFCIPNNNKNNCPYLIYQTDSSICIKALFSVKD